MKLDIIKETLALEEHLNSFKKKQTAIKFRFGNDKIMSRILITCYIIVTIIQCVIRMMYATIVSCDIFFKAISTSALALLNVPCPHHWCCCARILRHQTIYYSIVIVPSIYKNIIEEDESKNNRKLTEYQCRSIEAMESSPARWTQITLSHKIFIYRKS